MGGMNRRCRLCSEPMEMGPFPLCRTCLVERELVRNYVIKHSGVSIAEISQGTGVAYKAVVRMIKLGYSSKENNPAFQNTHN